MPSIQICCPLTTAKYMSATNMFATQIGLLGLSNKTTCTNSMRYCKIFKNKIKLIIEK